MLKGRRRGPCPDENDGFCARPEFEYENAALFRARESVEDQ